MWLITSIGFFSIVQKPGDKANGTLTVRSRVQSDLAALKQHYLPGLGPIQENHDTDYRFRAVAPRTEVSAAMTLMVDDLDYSNFKSEVGKTQGHKRASLYHKVWDVLYHLQKDPAFAEKEPLAESYGGVVVSGGQKVLLREPTKHNGGYAWTFAKTQAKPGESPQDAAVRAVLEKTGYDAEIRISVPGVFKGSATSTCYYVMDVKHPPDKPNWQTSGLRWANFDEARDLIRQSPNAEGRDRDLAILDAAEKIASAIPYKEHPNVQPEDWQDLKAMPERQAVLYPKLWFNPDEMAKIRRGFFPTVMEQKWFLYFTGDRLRMHRSWTGILIFDVGFAFDPKGGAYVTDVIVNRENREDGNTDDDEDLKMLEGIIHHHLLQPLEEPEVDGFVKAMSLAMQPKSDLF
jgi:ADP-ribose pyrophosphatase YjhB (NUDIX family)